MASLLTESFISLVLLHFTWPCRKDGRHTCMLKAILFSEVQEETCDHGAHRKHCKDKPKRQFVQVGIDHQACRRHQTITAGTPQRERQVRRLRQRGNPAAKERCRRQKEQAASQPSSSEAFTWPKWSMISASRTGLYRHQQVCKSQRLWRNTLITTYFSSNLQPDCKGKKKSHLGCFILCVHWEWSLWTVFLHFVITLIIIKYHFLWPPKRQVQ